MRDLEATDLANKQPSIYSHGMESVGTSSYSLRSLLIVILAFKICSQIIVILTFQHILLSYQYSSTSISPRFPYIPPFSLPSFPCPELEWQFKVNGGSIILGSLYIRVNPFLLFCTVSEEYRSDGQDSLGF
jgi:hypothetical protein